MRAKEFFIRAGKLLSAVLFLSVGLSVASQAAPGVTVNIPVRISVQGKAPDETYKVVMERVSEGSPLASPSEISRTGSGAKDYDLQFNIAYTAEGEYTYKVYQVKGNKENFKYDESIYTVIVKVEYASDRNADGSTSGRSLKAFIRAGRKETEKNGKIVFTNTYRKPGGNTPPGGGGDTPPGGGGDTPPTPTPPNPTQPTQKIPEVQGEVRPFDPVKAIQKVPEVFGAIRKVATGDSSSMALYGLFAATSMCSLFFWGIGQKKKEKKA